MRYRAGLFVKQHLDVGFTPVTDVGLAAVAKSLHSLTYLGMCGCERITDTGMLLCSESIT